MKTKYLPFALLLIAFGCRKEIDVSIPDSGRKIVLNAPLFADSLLEAFVARSCHIQDASSGYYTLNNATVDVYRDGALVETLPMVSYGYYASSTNRAEIGHNYEFRVAYTGLAPVNGDTGIPTAVEITKLDTVPVFHQDYANTMTLKITFNDAVAGEKDYYRMKIYLLTEYYISRGDGRFDTIRSIYSNGIYDISDMAYDFGDNYKMPIYFNDAVFDGKSYTFQVDLNDMDLNPYCKCVIVELEHLTQEYYYYCKSVNMQNNGEDIPIFTQVVTVYNNINGGFGIVGASTARRDTIYNKNWVREPYNQ